MNIAPKTNEEFAKLVVRTVLGTLALMQPTSSAEMHSVEKLTRMIVVTQTEDYISRLHDVAREKTSGL